ncbi:carbohydrate ABC transporter permease [Phototrophicus methaneseepsis]|uniref:Carbohydrate ABC transporter permease n=2 Tax=Phototrophicus methaneseepsis TaxID=2710758 RepID=A0A7S8EDT9_9CHLR|nr:carbohydrate ABC transporter permease [Phototrophicus methaneseepsis]
MALQAKRLREIVITLILTPIALIWIYPFLWMVSASFKTNNEIFRSGTSLIPDQFTFENFQRAWVEANISQYFLNTALIAIGSVMLVVMTTSMMGYALGRYSFPGKRIVIGIFIATVFLPKGYTIIPIFELISNLELDGSLLGVILAQSGGANVIFILLFMGYFSQLPKELEEAAIVDGAGFLRVFFQIMLPLSKPIIATVVIMQFIASWNDFLLPLVLTLARPELRTLSVGMYAFRGEYFTDWSGMAAAATIAIIPVILLFLVMQRYFIEGIAGAVKS